MQLWQDTKYINFSFKAHMIAGDLNTITLQGYLVRDEVPEILQNVHLAYIRRENSEALNHRSTSEPNLSEVVTNSSGSSSDNVNVTVPNGFPRACSLDSHLDEQVVNNGGEEPTVAERDIQMADAVQELKKSDSSTTQNVDENTAGDNNTNNEVKESVSGDPAAEIRISTNHNSNVVAVELHPQTCSSDTPPVLKPDKLTKPIPPPRKRKQGSLSAQTSASSAATSLQTTPKQVSPAKELPPSPIENNNLVSSDMTPAQDTDKSITNSNREEWKKQMLKQHLPHDYITNESADDDGPDVNNDLNASVDLDEIVIEGILPNGEIEVPSIMSESLMVQSTQSVEERHDAISIPNYNHNSPVLSRRPQHPLVMAARISSVSSSVSSGVAYEDQDIDCILDKLSLASTFTDKDDAKINTWEKIQIVEQSTNELPNESDKEKSSIQLISKESKEQPQNTVTVPNKKQKVNFKQDNNKNQVAENNTDGASKKFKMKHRQKLDKAQKRKAKYNHIHRGKEARSKSTNQVNRKRPNTNSLDRDALRIGEYFNAGDVCDFDFSRSTSIEGSQDKSEEQNDTTAIENLGSPITLQQYKYADDEIWVPMTQSTESEPGMRKVDINSPVKDIQAVTDGKQVKSSLLRQDAMETNFSRGLEQRHGENSPWIRRTHSDDNYSGAPRMAYPKNARIYHSQESDIL